MRIYEDIAEALRNGQAWQYDSGTFIRCTMPVRSNYCCNQKICRFFCFSPPCTQHTRLSRVCTMKKWRVYIAKKKRRSKKLRFISDPEINWLAIKLDGIIVHKQDFPENEIELPLRVRAQQRELGRNEMKKKFFRIYRMRISNCFI